MRPWVPSSCREIAPEYRRKLGVLRNRFSGRKEIIARYSRLGSGACTVVHGRSTIDFHPLCTDSGTEVIRDNPCEGVPRDLGIILEPPREEDPAHIQGEDNRPYRVHVSVERDDEEGGLHEDRGGWNALQDLVPQGAAEEEGEDRPHAPRG